MGHSQCTCLPPSLYDTCRCQERHSHRVHRRCTGAGHTEILPSLIHKHTLRAEYNSRGCTLAPCHTPYNPSLCVLYCRCRHQAQCNDPGPLPGTPRGSWGQSRTHPTIPLYTCTRSSVYSLRADILAVSCIACTLAHYIPDCIYTPQAEYRIHAEDHSQAHTLGPDTDPQSTLPCR